MTSINPSWSIYVSREEGQIETVTHTICSVCCLNPNCRYIFNWHPKRLTIPIGATIFKPWGIFLQIIQFLLRWWFPYQKRELTRQAYMDSWTPICKNPVSFLAVLEDQLSKGGNSLYDYSTALCSTKGNNPNWYYEINRKD